MKLWTLHHFLLSLKIKIWPWWTSGGPVLKVRLQIPETCSDPSCDPFAPRHSGSETHLGLMHSGFPKELATEQQDHPWGRSEPSLCSSAYGTNPIYGFSRSSCDKRARRGVKMQMPPLPQHTHQCKSCELRGQYLRKQSLWCARCQKNKSNVNSCRLEGTLEVMDTYLRPACLNSGHGFKLHTPSSEHFYH